MLIKQLRS